MKTKTDMAIVMNRFKQIPQLAIRVNAVESEMKHINVLKKKTKWIFRLIK
jgi:hypothetical protein